MSERLLLRLFFSYLFFSMLSLVANCQPVAVTKTNPFKVFVHYMPWFSAPQNPGSGTTSFGNGSTGSYNKWGSHWSNVSGNTRYPDNLITVINNNGVAVETRDICAHFHPLIGPYDGKDTAVLQYHLLLMKLSGIDGVMIDWYGQAGTNGDVGPLLITSNALIAQTPNVGLKFGLVMEDNFWGNANGTIPITQYAVPNGTYAINNYFNNPQFLKLSDLRGANATNAGSPIVCVFGPQKFKSPGQWNTILSGNTGAFLPLYNQSAQIGADAAGEFAWPYPQAVLNGGASNAWYTNLLNYYTNNAGAKNIVLGSAYPGFDDFYGSNGSDADGIIPRTYGGTTTLSSTLALNTKYKSVLDGLQLATWNDYSEGTIIEPTVEEGFQSLDTIQKFTGVPYTEADLMQVYRFFTLRKKYVGDATRQNMLNQVFSYFTSLQIPLAVALMNGVENLNAPLISVSSVASPSESGATGTFTISGSKIVSNTTVHYSMSGTRSDSGYTSSPVLTDSIVLTPSDTTVTFTITGIYDSIVSPNKTIILQLSTADTTYNVSGTGMAMMTVIDNRVPPCSGPIIVNTFSAPKIDGAIDSIWSRAPANLIGQTISGTIQTGSTWQAMYDSTNLYLLVNVKDSNLSNIGTNLWDQDGVEVYLAGNNSKQGAYTANDHQYRFNWNVFPYSTDNISGNTGTKEGIVYAIPTTVGGYTLEVSIPWTTIGGTAPVNLKQIGFDINLNDQQNNAGQREATVGWNGSNSDNYENTASFGTVQLTVCNASVIHAAPVIQSINTATGKEDYSFGYTILGSNNPSGFSAINLPAGLSIDPSSGTISGIPSVWGNFNTTISATNNIGTINENLLMTIDSTPAVLFSTISATRNIALGTASIQWIVDSEIVIKQYELQRSTDSIHFTTIQTISVIGNNNIDSVLYNSTDLNALSVDTYYRIEATSLNSSDPILYSPVAKLNKINAKSVYPNPVTGTIINIPFTNTVSSIYSIRLLNSIGQVVFSTSINVNGNGIIYPLQLNSKPAAGIYKLETIDQAGSRKVYNIVFVNN